MVVGGDGSRLDSGTHQVIHQHRLDLRLTALEVVSGDEGVVGFSQLEHARHEGVLRRSVDVGVSLENGSYGEDGGRSNL